VQELNQAKRTEIRGSSVLSREKTAILPVLCLPRNNSPSGQDEFPKHEGHKPMEHKNTTKMIEPVIVPGSKPDGPSRPPPDLFLSSAMSLQA